MSETLLDRLGRPMKHGRTKTPEYRAWQDMKTRCLKTNTPNYHRYGGRGISICERWLNSFEAFLSDIGERPSKQHSLDRIDNNGNYEPGNCRWATRELQNRNKATIRLITFGDKTLSLGEWAREIGVGQKTLEYRLNSGWTIEESLTLPVEQRSWGNSPTTTKVQWKRHKFKYKEVYKSKMHDKEK